MVSRPHGSAVSGRVPSVSVSGAPGVAAKVCEPPNFSVASSPPTVKSKSWPGSPAPSLTSFTPVKTLWMVHEVVAMARPAKSLGGIANRAVVYLPFSYRVTVFMG